MDDPRAIAAAVGAVFVVAILTLVSFQVGRARTAALKETAPASIEIVKDFNAEGAKQAAQLAATSGVQPAVPLLVRLSWFVAGLLVAAIPIVVIIGVFGMVAAAFRR